MSDGSPPHIKRAWNNRPLSLFGATVAGIGHLPGGPGTYAAIVTTPILVWMSHHVDLGWRLAALIVVTLIGCYWSQIAGDELGEPDSSAIVIDEVAGVWVTLVAFNNLTWGTALIGLVAFRIFDITKPPPARAIDDSHGGGIAVMADDVVAGLWAIPPVLLYLWLFVP